MKKLLFFYAISVTLMSCSGKCNPEIDNSPTNAVVDYEADSVYYRIDVKGDYHKELFLVTKNIVVGDSLFGIYTYDKWEQAWDYSKKKNKDPFFVYNVSLFENNKFQKISELPFKSEAVDYPILRQGDFSTLDTVYSKGFHWSGSNYLKIMAVSNTNMNSESINLNYKDGKWQVFSKEVIAYDSWRQLHGYCIDTTNNNYNISRLNFDIIFGSALMESNFICK